MTGNRERRDVDGRGIDDRIGVDEQGVERLLSVGAGARIELEVMVVVAELDVGFFAFFAGAK